MKKTTTAAILTMIAAIAVSGLTVAEENSKFTTNIDSSMEQDGKREIAELQSTAVTETIERNSDGVLNGNTEGSANSSNRDIANAAGSLNNIARSKAEDADSRADAAYSVAVKARDQAANAPEMTSSTTTGSCYRNIMTKWRDGSWVDSGNDETGTYQTRTTYLTGDGYKTAISSERVESCTADSYYRSTTKTSGAHYE